MQTDAFRLCSQPPPVDREPVLDVAKARASTPSKLASEGPNQKEAPATGEKETADSAFAASKAGSKDADVEDGRDAATRATPAAEVQTSSED
jgi:hypothetical protein